MINKQAFVIAYLSVALAITQFFWLRAEKRAAYLEGYQAGRQSILREEDGAEGTCYVKGGCNELQAIRHK